MFEYDFTFHSLTQAQRGRDVLHMERIYSFLGRSPRELAARGCGYVLRVRGKDAAQALTALRGKNIDFVHVYKVFEDGHAEEVRS